MHSALLLAEKVWVRCCVPGCFVWTAKPTKHGMCPIDIWDEHHDRWFAEKYGSTAQAQGIARLR